MALEDDILARWGQYGAWEPGRAREFADILRANGITDLTAFDSARLVETPDVFTDYQGGNADTGDKGQEIKRSGYQLQLGDKKLGFLGNINREGAYEGKGKDFLENTRDEDTFQLGWSSQGKGNTNYRLVRRADGSLVVAPEWGSSSDADSIRGGLLTMGAVLGGGYALNSMLGAGAGAGVGSTVGMTGAEAAAMAGGEVAAGTAGTQAAGASTGLLSGGTAGSTAAGSGIKFAASSLAPELGASLAAGTTAGVQGGSTLFSLGSWGLTGKDLITLGIAGMQGVAQSRQNEKNQEANDRRRAEDRENYLTDRQAVWNREDQKTAERDAKADREKQEAFARRMPVTGLLAPVLRRRGG